MGGQIRFHLARVWVLGYRWSKRWVQRAITAAQRLCSTKLIADLGALLRVPELIEVVQYVVSEMTRNVLEHAAADAFVCMQYYRKPGRVSIGIADCGRGVLASLESMHNYQTHAAAVVGALRPGVSGTTANLYGSPDNAGLGLFYARGLAKWSKQYFLIISGDVAYRLKRRQTARTPAADPRRDAHDMFESLNPWRGTVIAVDIAWTDSTLRETLRAIGDKASPNDGQSEMRSQIKFT